jgi:hypothetical protein
MDFMKWLNSLDEVFFPVTLWDTLFRPVTMVRYSNEELARIGGPQFTRAISPPLFLALTLALSSLVAGALGEPDAIVKSQHGMATLISDDKAALVVRVLLFSLFPLLMSVIFMRAAKLPLERMTLRRIFYGQCYAGAAFALLVSLGATLVQWPAAREAGQIGGPIIMLLAVGNYLIGQTRYFREELPCGWLRALGMSLAGLGIGAIFLTCVGLLMR